MTQEEMDELERRSRATLKARSRPVTLGQCRCCGVTLPAATAAEIDRGEARCPTATRVAAVYRASVDDLLAGIEAMRGAA